MPAENVMLRLFCCLSLTSADRDVLRYGATHMKILEAFKKEFKVLYFSLILPSYQIYGLLKPE